MNKKVEGGVMKMHLRLDAHRLNFLHCFYSANSVSGVRFQVSGKVKAIAYPRIKPHQNGTVA